MREGHRDICKLRLFIVPIVIVNFPKSRRDSPQLVIQHPNVGKDHKQLALRPNVIG